MQRHRSNPYEEDTSISLPEGCIAEDVEFDELPDGNIQQQQQPTTQTNGTVSDKTMSSRSEPRPLTFGFENGPLAVQSGKHNNVASEPQRSPTHASESAPFSGRDADAADAAPESKASAFCGWLPCFGGPDIEERFGRKFTLGERLADRVSSAVGSWGFVWSDNRAATECPLRCVGSSSPS
jgi:hypothetical protein